MTSFVKSNSNTGQPDADAWLIDMDGTLYWQFPVRLAMAMELLLTGARSIAVVRRFRREQEHLRKYGFQENGNCPYGLQISRTAVALNKTEDAVAAVVHEWMERRPTKWLRLFR